mmetsp:Transcript_111400/g.315376  ORF Transcript_111400/g.315376 Transcript_111400/m.315376 type:complete len:370 (-) Transcript_111400:65-1174(-)
MALARTTATLFSMLPPVKFRSTPTTCCCTVGALARMSARSGATAPASMTAALFSEFLDVRLCRALATCFCTPGEPVVSKAVKGNIAPADATATLLLPSLSTLLGVRLANALAMASWASAVPRFSNSTALPRTDRSRRSIPWTTKEASSCGGGTGVSIAGSAASIGSKLGRAEPGWSPAVPGASAPGPAGVSSGAPLRLFASAALASAPSSDEQSSSGFARSASSFSCLPPSCCRPAASGFFLFSFLLSFFFLLALPEDDDDDELGELPDAEEDDDASFPFFFFFFFCFFCFFSFLCLSFFLALFSGCRVGDCMEGLFSTGARLLGVRPNRLSAPRLSWGAFVAPLSLMAATAGCTPSSTESSTVRGLHV